MLYQRRFRLSFSILICFLLQAQGADKYTDENRPYEFGFNVEIDGNKQQHRHEKKDKDGIIMGEFGFVTADDVYHVTVYATDKEGRFKILSMKNIHLKSSSASSGPALSPRQGHALALPASVSGPAAPVSPQASPASTPKAPFNQISLQPPGRSCSSCSIPTTTVRAAPVAPPGNSPATAASPDIAQRNAFGSQPQSGSPKVQAYPQQPMHQHSIHTQPNRPQSIQPQENYPGSYGTGPIPNTPNNYAQSGPSVTLEQGMPPGFPGQHPSSSYPGQNPSQGYPGQSPSQGFLAHSTPHGFPGKSPEENYPQSNGQEYSNNLSPGQNSYPQGGSPGRTSKQYNEPQRPFDSNGGSNGPQGFNQVQPGQPSPVKPTLVSAQMQIVDKNTDVNALGPGETRGLPPGLTKDYMSQLLYTFNYTVGFHGHFEEGYTNGFKKGYYFVTGRNGVRTRIDYEADDTGFHPKVSQEVLDLLSEDVPKPETEKDEKYGLKGYEFKWLYYPVGSKKR